MTVNNAAGFPLLSVLIFLPALVGLLLTLVPRSGAWVLKYVALVAASTTFFLTLSAATVLFNPATPGPQLQEFAAWIPTLGIGYHLAVDGLSIWLVVLTAFLTIIAMLATWRRNEWATKETFILLLLLEAGILGALMAFDLVLFFIFWEAMLIPMYLLIGLVGSEGRMGAALKFFIYTTVGSLAMLLAIIALSFAHAGLTGQTTFDLLQLTRTPLPAGAQMGLFLAFALAFAIKVPLFPLHTWLPDTYARMPLAGLVLGTMLVKVGAYGFLRFCFTLFPDASAQAAPVMAALAVITILYGWFSAFGQRDLVRLIAYTSMAHMGFIVLGAFAFNSQGIKGSVLQMVNHGITTSALFILAAALIHRAGTADLGQFGGFGGRYPVMYGIFLLVLFSSVGLPGLNGFIGEFLILMGAYLAMPAFALIALLGIVMAATVMLWMFRVSMQGPQRDAANPTQPVVARDLSQVELMALAPLAALIIVIGLFPNIFLDPMESSVNQLVTDMQAARQQVTQMAEGQNLLALITPETDR